MVMDNETHEHRAIHLNEKISDPSLSDETRYDYLDLSRFPGNTNFSTESSQRRQFLLPFSYKQSEELSPKSNDLMILRETERENFDPILSGISSLSLMPCHKYALAKNKRLRRAKVDSLRYRKRYKSPYNEEIKLPNYYYSPERYRLANQTQRKLKEQRYTQHVPSNFIYWDADQAIELNVTKNSQLKTSQDNDAESVLSNQNQKTSYENSFFLTEPDHQFKRIRKNSPTNKFDENTNIVSKSLNVSQDNNRVRTASANQKSNATQVGHTSGMKILKKILENAKPKVVSQADSSQGFMDINRLRLKERIKNMNTTSLQLRPMRYNLVPNDYQRGAERKFSPNLQIINSQSESQEKKFRASNMRTTLQMYNINNQIYTGKSPPGSRNSSASSRSPASASNSLNFRQHIPEKQMHSLRKTELPFYSVWKDPSQLKTQSRGLNESSLIDQRLLKTSANFDFQSSPRGETYISNLAPKRQLSGRDNNASTFSNQSYIKRRDATPTRPADDYLRPTAQKGKEDRPRSSTMR